MSEYIYPELNKIDRFRNLRREYTIDPIKAHKYFLKYIRDRQNKYPTIKSKNILKATTLKYNSLYVRFHNTNPKQKMQLHQAFWLVVCCADNYDDAIRLIEFSGNTFCSELLVMSIIDILLQQFEYWHRKPDDRIEKIKVLIEQFGDESGNLSHAEKELAKYKIISI